MLEQKSERLLFDKHWNILIFFKKKLETASVPQKLYSQKNWLLIQQCSRQADQQLNLHFIRQRTRCLPCGMAVSWKYSSFMLLIGNRIHLSLNTKQTNYLSCSFSKLIHQYQLPLLKFFKHIRNTHFHFTRTFLVLLENSVKSCLFIVVCTSTQVMSSGHYQSDQSSRHTGN